MAEAHAKLVVHWVSQPDETIELVYNPTELSFEKSAPAGGDPHPGRELAVAEFGGGAGEKADGRAVLRPHRWRQGRGGRQRPSPDRPRLRTAAHRAKGARPAGGELHLGPVRAWP